MRIRLNCIRRLQPLGLNTPSETSTVVSIVHLSSLLNTSAPTPPPLSFAQKVLPTKTENSCLSFKRDIWINFRFFLFLIRPIQESTGARIWVVLISFYYVRSAKRFDLILRLFDGKHSQRLNTEIVTQYRYNIYFIISAWQKFRHVRHIADKIISVFSSWLFTIKVYKYYPNVGKE